MEHFIQPVAFFSKVNKCCTKILTMQKFCLYFPQMSQMNSPTRMLQSQDAISQENTWCWKHQHIPAFVPTVCEHCVLARVGGCTCVCVRVCMCPCGCCTINSELCPEHITADQRRPRSMLLIECTGQCACASRHLWAEPTLVCKCQLSSPHRELKTSPHFLVSLWGVVMCVCVRERGGEA